MSDKDSLLSGLKAILGSSTEFWTHKTANADDYYEAYLWALVVEAAKLEGWSVTFANAGAANDEFLFRRGPGKFSSSVPYTYAILRDGNREGELHIGIRVRGRSGVLHEYDVVAFDKSEMSHARRAGGEPNEVGVRLHIEAKLHKNDLSLGLGRELVGLGADCPTIHPMLVSKSRGSPNIRALVKCHGGTYVNNVYPGDSGLSFILNCLKAAFFKWP